MANPNHSKNNYDIGGKNNLNSNTNNHSAVATNNFGAIGHGQVGSSHLSHINNSQHQLQPASNQNASALNHAISPGLNSGAGSLGGHQPLQHQSSAGLGVHHVPDAAELRQIASMLLSAPQRLDGLEKLAAALARTPARRLLCSESQSNPATIIPAGVNSNLREMFKGLRACLQVSEASGGDAERNSEALLRVNQILYDMMQDLPRSPNELLPQVTELIPYFIENLGNSKATVRKSTHKCIGTFVKFSKRLEYVLQSIITYGLENTNQRTRQHSMLVIPALISLKAAVINAQTTEMKHLIEAVISRLRDPADSVAKTAKKLLLELQKCYPNVFKSNYIDTLAIEDERLICNLILENRFEEASKLVMSTSPSRRMAHQQASNTNTGPNPIPAQQMFNPPGAASSNTDNTFGNDQLQQPVGGFGAIGKAIVPTNGAATGQQPLPVPMTMNQSMSMDQRGVDRGPYHDQNHLLSAPNQMQQSTAASPYKSGSSTTQQQPGQQANLSVVGREIMSSQIKAKPTPPSGMNSVQSRSEVAVANPNNEEHKQYRAMDSQSSSKRRSQTQSGLPIDTTNGLVFGFLEEDTVEALNENNQWKDRTSAMERIESQLLQLLGNSTAKSKFTEQTATQFLGFIYQYITDINFKISLASIKIVTLLLQEDLINLKVYFTSLLSNLIEKLSDSKQVVRDEVMACCCNLINRSKPAPFASQVIKYLQHANWHVREGVLILLCRCLLVALASEANKKTALKPNMVGETSALGQICTNSQLVEEICFLVKVEDKKVLQQMGIDCLALMIAKSPQKGKTDAIVTKELGVIQQSDGSRSTQSQQFGSGLPAGSAASTKDNQIYAQIQQRIQEQALPFINSGTDLVEFAPPSSMNAGAQAPSTQFLQHRQNNSTSITSPSEHALSESGQKQPVSEIQQISQSLQQMQINSNFTAKAGAIGGPSSKMMQANQPGLLNQISPANNAYKTPSMAFLESKRREEEKQMNQQQNYPQSADFKKVATGPLSPISAPSTSNMQAINSGGSMHQNQQSSYSMRKLQQKDRKGNGGPASQSEDENKIAMWLPSFSPMPEAASSQQPSTVARKQDMISMQQSPIMTSVGGKDPRTGLGSMQLSQEFSNQSPQVIPRSTKGPQPSTGSYHLNATASSSATFIEGNARIGGGQGSRQQVSTYTDQQANKTQSDMSQPGGNGHHAYQQNHPNHHIHSHHQMQQQQNSSNQQPHTQHQALQQQQQQNNRAGYIPEAHTNKPRNIHSNYDKQRTFNQSQGSNNSSNQSSQGPSQQTIAGTTAPTNNSNGFDKSQISDRLQLLKNTNKYKTKAGEGGTVPIIPPQDSLSHQNHTVGPDFRPEPESMGIATQQTMNYTVGGPEPPVEQTSHPHSMYNKRQGPIRAAHLTINQEPKGAQQQQHQNVGNKKMSAHLPTQVQLKQRQSHQLQMANGSNSSQSQQQSSQKPPIISQYSNFSGVGGGNGPSHTQYDETSRASSIEYQQNSNHPNQQSSLGGANGNFVRRPPPGGNNRAIGPGAAQGPVSQSEKKPGGQSKLDGTGGPQSLANMIKQDSTQVYEAKEEPLQNPEVQLRSAIESLKSSDWSKTFEGCKILIRGVMFHKNLFSHPSSMTAQTFKDIVKAVDSLRSQVAKQACIFLSTMFQELQPRDVDSHIETVMPTVLKRSTDTNTFISTEAEKTLIAICHNCTETRVFAALQAQVMKSAAYKEKVCLCYVALIERLAHKLKNFRDLERLVQSVVRFLSEGAVEVRNQAKYAVLTLQSQCNNQRELDGILLKARLNDNQMEKVKKVLASEDFESLSNYANTRYGASMRASPLGGARHTQYNAGGPAQPRHMANGSYGASGSDGFQRNNLNNMQQTFLSSGAVVPNNNTVARGGSSGPIGTSGIGNPIPRGVGIGGGGVGGGPMSDNHATMQRGATSNQGSSSGFDGTQNTFNKRTTSVSKPVDRQLVEEMKTLVDSCNTNDWQKRVKAIDQLEQFARTKSMPIRNSPASFINLMDAYCKLLQDNNTKVQTKAQQSFQTVLRMEEMGALACTNLTMLVQSIAQNLCSTNTNVRNHGDRLFDDLENVVINESRGNTNALLQPIVGCLGQPQNKVAKPHLVDRLTNLVERVDKHAIITRLLNPLVQPGHKVQVEANGNVALKQALQRLAVTIQSAEVGFNGMGVGLKGQY